MSVAQVHPSSTAFAYAGVMGHEFRCNRPTLGVMIEPGIMAKRLESSILFGLDGRSERRRQKGDRTDLARQFVARRASGYNQRV